MATCLPLDADLMRDLQREINCINIQLSKKIHTSEEREFLRGKSAGIFLAMEIINEENEK